MITSRISKLEIKTRKKIAEINAIALPGQLSTLEGRREVFKQFPVKDDKALVAAKIRIIQQYATVTQTSVTHGNVTIIKG